MKITFLTPSDNLTGGTRVIATYARELQQRGHEVCVVSNAPDRPPWRERLRLRLRLRQSPQKPPAPGHIALSGVPHRVLDRPRAIQLGDLPEADVLIATWWETAVWMHAMPASRGRKVHLVQGYEVWTGGEPCQLGERVHAALRLPNCKIAISQALAHEIEGHVGPLGFTVVPNAVDLGLFNAPPRARRHTPTVGYIYARTPIKGSDLCAHAIALAREQVPHLKVLAFGVDTPTDAWPLPPGAEFVHCPAQQDIAALYARCDAWLFASRLDSFGLPILEAMACRTPVIGVPVGAANELLGEGGGVLVPPEDPVAMAQALVELCLQSDAAWREMSERAHQRAHRYSWADATTRLLRAIGDKPGAAHDFTVAPGATAAPD